MVLAFNICQTLGKVNLSSLAILSIMTHPEGLNYQNHLENIFKVFEMGVRSDEQAIQKETSRVIGDFANTFMEQPEL